MITENLSTLKIHKLTQAQYDREFEAGRIDENALYLTPDEAIDLTPYAKTSQVVTATEVNDEDSWIAGCYKRTLNLPWYFYNNEEWLNPPMSEGGLYCTMERFAGSPVYKLAWMNRFSSMQANESIVISRSIPSHLQLIEVSGTIENGAQYRPIDDTISVIFEDGELTATNNNNEAYNVYLTVKFADFS